MENRAPWLALPILFLASGCFSTARVPRPAGPPLPVTRGAFPHQALDALQRKHVDGSGRVDYQGLAADRLELQRYLTAVAEHSPDSDPDLFPTREEQLAYWINGYNAYVLWAVLERPGMRSVSDEKTDFFYFTEYELGGASWSLYNLENDVIRERFSEPRIHMAVNCASAGCPELPAEAFLPEKLEAQLAREAARFCAHPDKVRVEGNVVKVSQIFEWYAADFEPGGPVEFCRKWGREDLPSGAKVEYIPYDWALNAQPGRALFESSGALARE